VCAWSAEALGQRQMHARERGPRERPTREARTPIREAHEGHTLMRCAPLRCMPCGIHAHMRYTPIRCTTRCTAMRCKPLRDTPMRDPCSLPSDPCNNCCSRLPRKCPGCIQNFCPSKQRVRSAWFATDFCTRRYQRQ
jgi:hypothetical protein